MSQCAHVWPSRASGDTRISFWRLFWHACDAFAKISYECYQVPENWPIHLPVVNKHVWSNIVIHDRFARIRFDSTTVRVFLSTVHSVQQIYIPKKLLYLSSRQIVRTGQVIVQVFTSALYSCSVTIHFGKQYVHFGIILVLFSTASVRSQTVAVRMDQLLYVNSTFIRNIHFRYKRLQWPHLDVTRYCSLFHLLYF